MCVAKLTNILGHFPLSISSKTHKFWKQNQLMKRYMFLN
jgi:hypothetical protein